MLPFDEILTKYLGEFGLYQGWVLFLMCFAEIPVGFHQVASVFLAAVPAHHCSVPGLVTSRDCQPLPRALDMSLPWTQEKNESRQYSQCLRYNLTEQEYNVSSAEFWQTHSPESLSAGGTLSCDRGWEYDCETFTSTIVTEWDIVCSASWLKRLTTALYMVGVMVGAVVFGDLADRLGRRPSYLLSLVIQCVFGVAAAFSPNLVLFVIFRFFVGAATSGVIIVSCVMVAEFVGPSERVKVGVFRPMFFAVGEIIFAGIAYGIRDWRMLQLAISLPNLLYIPYFWWCPESPRWLMSRDQEKAKEVTLRMARVNKVNVPDEAFSSEDPESIKEESSRKYSIVDLLRTPNMRTRSLKCFYVWFTCSLVFYGFSLNITDLSGNIYLNFLISSLMEFPAYVSLLYLQERFGRKIPVFTYLFLTGLGLIIVTVLPPGPSRVAVAMLSKLCITGGFQGIMIYSIELFPTVVRNTGMGSSSMAARFGATISPFLWLLADFWRPAPYLLFSIMTVLAGLLCMLLPETKGLQLPQTLEDGEEFGKGVAKKMIDTVLTTLKLKKGNDDVEDKVQDTCQTLI
ncbi:PREDICTED: organic cation transporter protein-like [Branchiostoma belcheri]|uniref:Organic cation transporter protein-like n=1 Tax=Branchiostoma belcheri TaxID=7741 RepID=A0A6P4ZQB5_BRABE|nr:PREDICTED: organic cation transporter protein-like [Branchiostoma belcheri]